MSNQDPLAVSALAISALEKRLHEGLCLAAGADQEQALGAFAECVIAAPGRAEYTQEFLSSLQRTGQPRSGKATDSPAVDALKRAAAKGDWNDVYRRGTGLLMEQPRSLPVLLILADACAAQGFDDAESCWVRAAVAVAESDVAIQRWGAAALARLRDDDGALACWRRVEDLDPADEEAPQAISTLVISRSRRHHRLPVAGESPASSDLQQSHERFQRWPVYSLSGLVPVAPSSGHALTPMQQLEATIRERPSIPEPYLRLAELYLEKDRDYDAERLLAKARDATDNDARVQQMWEEVSLLRHARRVRSAEEEQKNSNNPQTQEAVVQAKKERDKTELDIFRARVKRQPDCAESRYELGRRLLRGGKLREAAEHFEKSLADPNWRAAAALELGQCQAESGDLVRALHFYRRGADAALASQGEMKRAALERASKIAARLKLPNLARRYAAAGH